MRRILLGLCLAGLLGTTAISQQPSATEIAVFEAAQSSGRVEDYQTYLKAYPNGTFAEAVRFELQFLGAEIPEVALPPLDVTFNSPLPSGPEGVAGRSIAELLATGTPLFPPIEGLPEEVWKDQPCATCHKWTVEDLCVQAQTYSRPDTADRMTKPHPLGLEFKQALKAFGEGGCRAD